MTGLEAHVVHLYPRWVLFRGNGTVLCIYRQPLKFFCSIVFAMIFIYYKNSKTQNISGFGALVGQIQHMAAQEVRFTPRPVRYGPPSLHVSSSAALHIRAELDTCKLGEPCPRSMQKPFPFWASVSPLWYITSPLQNVAAIVCHAKMIP